MLQCLSIHHEQEFLHLMAMMNNAHLTRDDFFTLWINNSSREKYIKSDNQHTLEWMWVGTVVGLVKNKSENKSEIWHMKIIFSFERVSN